MAVALCWFVPLIAVGLAVWLVMLMRDSTYRVAESLNPDRAPSHGGRTGAAHPHAPGGDTPAASGAQGASNSASADGSGH